MLLMLVDWARQKRLSKHVHLDGMTLTRLETGMDSSIPNIAKGTTDPGVDYFNQ